MVTINKIKDMRGGAYSANYLQIENGKLYYYGMPVVELQKSNEWIESAYAYEIISGKNHRISLGYICLTDDDAKKAIELINKRSEEVEFTRVNSDVNGNPRFVCHFLAFINEGDDIKSDTYGMGAISEKYRIAVNKARELGGRKFHNKQYGGGIVFQMYDGQRTEMSQKINELKQVNTNFLKEWTPKQFKQVEKAIYNHFAQYHYNWQPTHDKSSRTKFYPFSFEQIDNLLGLAYTSTGIYAGLWVCNGGYMMANDTHHFTGFAINADGRVIGIVEDENEQEIFIEL